MSRLGVQVLVCFVDVFILTHDRTPVLIPGNPRETNTAGRRIRQIQLHGGVRTTCGEPGHDIKRGCGGVFARSLPDI